MPTACLLQEPFFDGAGPVKESMVSAFATFAALERARISERTLAGLAKARSQGRVGGRPKAEDDVTLMRNYRKLRAKGLTVRAIAEELDISPTTVVKLSRADAA